MTNKVPESLASLYAKPQKNITEEPSFIPFMKIDYDQDGFKIREKENDEYIWRNIGDDLKIQILLITTYYSAYDMQKRTMAIETNKCLPGEDITVFDYNSNTHTVMSPKDFKTLKAQQKAEGINLKFARSLIVKVLEGEYKGELFDFSVKLSQSHGMSKDKRYLFDDPMPGSLAQYLIACDNVYPAYSLEMSVCSYSMGAINVKYPHFTVEEEVDINEEEIREAIKKTQLSDDYRKKKIDEAIFDM